MFTLNSRFWIRVKDIAPIADTDVAAVDRIMAAGANIHAVKDDILNVASRNLIGFKMFGHNLAVIVVTAYNTYLTEIIAASGDTLTQEQWDDITEKASHKAEELKIDEANPDPRFVNCGYFTLQLSLAVKNAAEQCEWFLSVKGKVLLIKHHDLKQLWFEKEVLGEVPKSAKDPEVPAEKVAKFANFRAVFEQQIPARNCSNGTILLQQIKNKQGVFGQLDNTQCIEEALARALVGTPGAEKLQAEMLKQFPSDISSGVTLSMCRVSLEQVLMGSLFKFCNSGAQALANAVVREIKTMERNEEPNVAQWGTNTFLNHCLTLSKFFCINDKAKPPSSGEVAATTMWNELKARADKKEKVSVVEVKFFLAFSWLLTAQQRGEVLTVLKKVMRDLQQVAAPAAGGAGIATTVSSTGSPAKKKMKPGKAVVAASKSSASSTDVSASTVDDVVLGLFA